MGKGRRILRTVAVGLYLAVTRAILLVVVLVPSLYFVLNSSPFPGQLTRFLRTVLPGTIEIGTLQIAPIPWKVDILDVRIRAPDGESIIAVGTLRVTVDLLPLVRWVAGRDPDIVVHLPEVRLYDYEAMIDFNPDGHLRLVDAFSVRKDPDAPPPPPPTGPRQAVRLVFDRVVGERGSCRVSFPEWDVRVEDIALEARFELETSPTTHVKVMSSRVSWTHGIGHVRAAPQTSLIPREVVLGPGGVEGFVYDWDRISYQHAAFAFPGMDLDSRNGFLAWSENLRYQGEADLEFADGSPLIQTATGGKVTGPLRIDVDGRGDAFDPRFTLNVTSPGMALSGVDLGRVEMALTGGLEETGRYAFQGIRFVTDSSRGKVKLDGGVLYPFGSSEGIAADGAFVLDAEALNIPTLLRDLGVEPPAPPAPLPRVVSGHLQVRAEVASWATGVASAHVSGSLEGLLSPGTLLAGADVSVTLDASANVTGDYTRPAIRVEELAIRSGPDSARARGTVDLARGELDASGQVDKDLKSLLSALGMRGRGRATLSDLRVHGPLKAPNASALATVTGLSIDPWEVDQARARLSWKDGSLSLTTLEASTPYGALTASDVAVRLLDPKSFRPLPSPRLSVRQVLAPALDLARIPPLKDGPVKGKASLEVDRLDLDLGNPLHTLDGAIRASASWMVVSGRPLTGVSVEATAASGVVTLSSVGASLKGGGRARVTGTLDLPAGRFEAVLDGEELSLPVVAGMKQDGALQGVVNIHATASGPYLDPVLDAHVDANGVAYGDQRFGDLSFDAARNSGGNLMLSSDRFLPRMHLNEASGLTWADGHFTGLVVMIDLNRVTPQDIVPSIKQRDLWGQLTGNLQVRMGFGSGGTLEAALTSPPDGLRLGFFDREVALKNVEKLVVAVLRDGSVSVTGLALDDGRDVLRVCGTVLDPDGNMRLWVRGPVGAYWLRQFGSVFSVSDGYVRLSGAPGATVGAAPPGCGPSIAAGDGPVVVSGTFSRPLVDGEVRVGGIEIGIRDFGDVLRIQEGGRILLSSSDGRLRASIPQDGWIRGTLGDGAFTLHGDAAFDGLVPAEGEIQLDGAGLRFVSAGEYFLVGNPSVTAQFEGLGTPGQSRLRISGRVAITEGSYHKNFGIVGRSFSGLAGPRVAAPQGRSLEDVVPWLADADLDLAVTAPRFGVRSKLDVGSTDFDISMDLRVKGKVKAPELWNRVEILPGGTVTYEVVRRVFEVVRGRVDFDGPPDQPLVDLTARTFIQIQGASTQSTAVASRFDPDAAMSGALTQGIQVSLKVAGRYPDLDITLASNSKAYNQTDLQYLVLTGALPQGGVAGSAGQVFNVGLLTEEVTGVVTRLLLGSLVDAINLGVSPAGGVSVDVIAHLGSRLRFETQVQQTTGAGSAWYTAGFHVRLTDYLSLEGRVLSVSQGAFDKSVEAGNKYETKLRFRIPIE
jgi:hypothetical protein